MNTEYSFLRRDWFPKQTALLIFLTLFMAFPHTDTIAAPAQPAENSLGGTWLLEMTSPDIGTVRMIMTFESDSATFIAYTRKKAANDILGGFKTGLAKLFTKDFEEGCLARIYKGKITRENNKLILKGVFSSPLGRSYFAGTVSDGRMTAELLDRNQKNRGTITGTKNTMPLPLADYRALIRNATDTTKLRIFKREMTTGKAWNTFERRISKRAALAQDDLEMVFSFFYLAGKLPFSHYALIKTVDDTTAGGADEANVSFEMREPGVGYLKVSSFDGTAAEMDNVFEKIFSSKPDYLIIDLRDNGGGTVEAGMELASFIVDSTYYGGVFLTQKWFATHTAPPPLNDYPKLPLFNASSFELIIKGIHEQEGLCLQVVPAKQHYPGKVYVLTNGNTASTCEPLVHAFRHYKLAVIVGEKTAGAMLNGEFFPLQEGFSLVVPTADYYACDGQRLDHKGVEPNIKIKQAEALDHVLRVLIPQDRKK